MLDLIHKSRVKNSNIFENFIYSDEFEDAFCWGQAKAVVERCIATIIEVRAIYCEISMYKKDAYIRQAEQEHSTGRRSEQSDVEISGIFATGVFLLKRKSTFSLIIDIERDRARIIRENAFGLDTLELRKSE